MEKGEFSRQYKHPNWQKKRLEALQEAEFTCQNCFDNESQLHVHHKRYVKGRAIWEYQTWELEVLCEECHEYAHQTKDQLQELIARLPVMGMSEIMGLILGYCEAVTGPCNLGGVYPEWKDSPDAYEAGILAGRCCSNMSVRDIGSLSDEITKVDRHHEHKIGITTTVWSIGKLDDNF